MDHAASACELVIFFQQREETDLKATTDHSIHATPAAFVALLMTFVLLATSCVSSGYRAAPKDTAAPQFLNVAFAPDRLDAKLVTVITYNGPGSWKRNAFWDEYIVTLHNAGSEPVTIATAGLIEYDGTVRAAGAAPWALEKESKSLEQKYRAAGIAFVRYTAPGALIVGGGLAAAASAGILSAAAATAATVTVVALPLYYIGVLTINHSNKGAMEKQFKLRRLVEPLTLAAGETRTGSFFFPMVPSPRALTLRWSDSASRGDAAVQLDFLRDLHVKPVSQPAPASASQALPSPR
jgi:hypothetical protein